MVYWFATKSGMSAVVGDESGEIGTDFWTIFCRQGIHHFYKLGSYIGVIFLKKLLREKPEIVSKLRMLLQSGQ